MLRKIRITLAVISIVLVTLLFLDFTGTVHHYLGWMTKIQLLPALLAVNVGVLIFLVVLTLLFGRVYCSVICPLGIFQDIVSRFSGKFKRNRFAYLPAKNWLRYGVLVIFIICLIAGVSIIVTLLAPYGAYGRMASNLLSPVYKWGNNLLAYFAERADSYAFYHVDVWIKSIGTFAVAILTFLLVGYLAWRSGRTYCNTICPVGTVLGFIARFSLLKPVIDTQACNHCGLCSRNCKASCINSKEQEIDYSRCVACMDCIDKCTQGAIHYKLSFGKSSSAKKEVAEKTANDESNARRKFLTTASILAVGGLVTAQEKVVEGSLAMIEDKQKPKRTTKLTPPGSLSIKNFADNCVACGLCISVCPNDLLSPTSSFKGFMQPEMSYELGYCRPECTKCSDVCPTGSIKSIDKEEKSATKIGTAVWVRESCIITANDAHCGACARHCPTDAIQMVREDPDDKKSKRIPTVDSERCIGCGKCEYLCPARPFSGIYVEGIENHRTI